MATTAAHVGTSGEFDLQPDPRVLQMLGEIDLDPWRCIAELVDNGIDGFLHADRAATPVVDPEIRVTLPNRDDASAKVQIYDNGPGMDGEALERAVRAGYSGNNPTDSLGLFGMGFNIATARLGATTTVWSTRAGDDVVHGVKIDFADLRARRSFKTPHLVQSKADSLAHFTRIEISNLKPDQRRFLARSGNQRAVKAMLAKSYSAMLRPNGSPIHFTLRVNDVPLAARQHCVWGDDRTVEVPGVGPVHAYRHFDHKLAIDSVVCSHCLTSMLETDIQEDVCLGCGRTDGLLRRERRIRGWIGLQRYLSTNDFGIDFIRNGRKIEIASKDLFLWTHEGVTEVEYPIDDQRNRGRFVGEVHLDHCPVDYSKQRFDRAHRSWREMVSFIRGEGPLRPQKAEELNFGPNHSILFTHFKAFRRSNPSSNQAGGWARVLVVRDNDRATQMAEEFHRGTPEYQSDAKWWELVQEEDEKRLYGGGSGGGSGGGGSGGEDGAGDDIIKEIFGDGDGDGESGAAEGEGGEPGEGAATEPPPPERERVASLSQLYEYPKPSNISFQVEAFRVRPEDPDLEGRPWRLRREDPRTRTFNFLFDEGHDVFESITMSPLDALLNELAWLVHESTRSLEGEISASAALASLRARYAVEESLNPTAIAQAAEQTLKDLSTAIISVLPEAERPGLFDDFPEDEQARVTSNIMVRGGSASSLKNGGFLRYFPELLPSLVDRRPGLFFDGGVWDTEYETLDLKDPQATLEAQRTVRERARSRISDAVSASSMDRLDESPRRDEMIRAVTGLRLLVPDRAFD